MSTENGSRICDTNRNPLGAGVDSSVNITDTTALYIFAGGVIGSNGDELKGGDDHTWQFRAVGGVFQDVTLVSTIKLADVASLVSGTLLANANRRANSGGTFVTVGREFEDFNPTTQGQTLKDVRVGESQIGLDLSATVAGVTYEMQCIWTDKNAGNVPLIYTAKFIISGGGGTAPALNRNRPRRAILAR